MSASTSASGHFTPAPVSTHTTSSSGSSSFRAASASAAATEAAEDGSTAIPCPASRRMASRIAASGTASAAPPDSATARSEAGPPVSSAIDTAIVCGSGCTGTVVAPARQPWTIGSQPAACTATIRGSAPAAPSARSSRKPFHGPYTASPPDVGTSIRPGKRPPSWK